MMLSETEIQQIAEIDRQNMSGMIAAMGNVYSADRRKADVVKEIERNTKFVTVKRDDIMLAYLSYRITGDDLKIMSIQLAPYTGRLVLRLLVRKTLLLTAGEDFNTVSSKVFSNNHNSIRFHYKLGFSLNEERDGICYFRIECDNLLRRVSRLVKS